MRYTILILLSYLMSVMFFPPTTLAQTPDLYYFHFISVQVLDLINFWLIPIIFALALIFFLWGLAMFIRSAGDEEKRKEGKQRMVLGAIVFTVMIGIWGIVKIITNAFGIDDALAPPIPKGPEY